MGNTPSAGLSGRMARIGDASPQYLGCPRLPHELHVLIASHLCPHCADPDAFLSTEDARELQIGLGNMAAASRYLLNVANEHRFHAFVLPFRRGYEYPSLGAFAYNENVNSAMLLKTHTIPELLERLIQYRQLSRELRYLSIRDFTLTYKAGITKRRLRLFIDASSRYGIPVPSFVPMLLVVQVHSTVDRLDFEAGDRFWVDEELWLVTLRSRIFDAWLIKLLLFGLAPCLEKLLIDPVIAELVFFGAFSVSSALPSVVSLFVSESKKYPRGGAPAPQFRTQELFPRFPNLRNFQNHDPGLIMFPIGQDPSLPPPLFPNIRKLTLAVRQCGRLQHVTQILREFSQLQELVYHRSPSDSSLGSMGDLDFSNANLFDGVHHCLRKLTYSSTIVRPRWRMASEVVFYQIEITSYEQRRFSDVPHFGAFEVLEHLTIDQGLLGRLSPVSEYHDPQIGPRFPELSWNLPRSLRSLYVRFVYDSDQLAGQLISVARAKAKDGRFPHLSDIYITCVEDGTYVYEEDWPPQIPLLPTNVVMKLAGEVMMEAGVYLWSVGSKIAPPPGEPDEHPTGVIPAGIPIKFAVQQAFFPEL